MFKWIYILIVLVIATGCSSEKNKLDEVFFGVHYNYETIDPLVNNEIIHGSVRLWDTKTSWRHLEPSKGNYDFEELDRIVDKHIRNNQEILLVLGQPPNWATKVVDNNIYGDNYNASPPDYIDDWKNYLTVVAERYKGKINSYEIWNEPNMSGFYNGSIEDLVSLTKEAHKVIKDVSPEAAIVSPSTTGKYSGAKFLDNFLKAGGGEYIDVIGVHLYVYPEEPEDSIPVVNEYKRILEKHDLLNMPIWNTEFTWINYSEEGEVYANKPMEIEQQISYLSRSFLIHIAFGIEKSFIYGVGFSDSKIEFYDSDINEYSSHLIDSFNKLVRWLSGSEFISVDLDKGVYVLNFDMNNEKFSIIWSEDKGEEMFKLDENYFVNGTYETLIKIDDKEYSGKLLPLNNLPVLVKNK